MVLIMYTARVVIRQNEMSDKEKEERVKKFQQAFVVAAVSYYSNKIKSVSETPIENCEGNE